FSRSYAARISRALGSRRAARLAIYPTLQRRCPAVDAVTMPASDLPAALGGDPLFPHGPPDWPPPDDGVRRALDAAFADGSWGKYHGGHVGRLEAELARRLGVPHALTCSSGTLAVEVALRALGVGAGDVALAAYDYGGNFLSVHAVG